MTDLRSFNIQKIFSESGTALHAEDEATNSCPCGVSTLAGKAGSNQPTNLYVVFPNFGKEDLGILDSGGKKQDKALKLHTLNKPKQAFAQ